MTSDQRCFVRERGAHATIMSDGMTLMSPTAYQVVVVTSKEPEGEAVAAYKVRSIADVTCSAIRLAIDEAVAEVTP